MSQRKLGVEPNNSQGDTGRTMPSRERGVEALRQGSRSQSVGNELKN